jgi:hypothetical protein
VPGVGGPTEQLPALLDAVGTLDQQSPEPSHRLDIARISRSLIQLFRLGLLLVRLKFLGTLEQF